MTDKKGKYGMQREHRKEIPVFDNQARAGCIVLYVLLIQLAEWLIAGRPFPGHGKSMLGPPSTGHPYKEWCLEQPYAE